jgi:hypothetical protein
MVVYDVSRSQYLNQLHTNTNDKKSAEMSGHIAGPAIDTDSELLWITPTEPD